jgi:hypothetical protein
MASSVYNAFRSLAIQEGNNMGTALFFAGFFVGAIVTILVLGVMAIWKTNPD